MRIRCFHCGKSVSTEVPDDTLFRAIAECPECIAKNEEGPPSDPVVGEGETGGCAEIKEQEANDG